MQSQCEFFQKLADLGNCRSCDPTHTPDHLAKVANSRAAQSLTNSDQPSPKRYVWSLKMHNEPFVPAYASISEGWNESCMAWELEMASSQCSNFSIKPAEGVLAVAAPWRPLGLCKDVIARRVSG